MPKTLSAYLPEYRARIIELARAGRTPEELARELEPAATRSGHDGLRERRATEGSPASHHEVTFQEDQKPGHLGIEVGVGGDPAEAEAGVEFVCLVLQRAGVEAGGVIAGLRGLGEEAEAERPADARGPAAPVR